MRLLHPTDHRPRAWMGHVVVYVTVPSDPRHDDGSIPLHTAIEHLVRKENARMREALVEAIGRALGAVTPEDAASYFAHAGYWPQDQPL